MAASLLFDRPHIFLELHGERLWFREGSVNYSGLFIEKAVTYRDISINNPRVQG